MATFGYTGNGDTETSANGSTIYGSKYTLSESASVSSLSCRLYNTSGSSVNARCIIYDDNGTSAQPGTRMGQTNEVVIPNGTTQQHIGFDFASPVALTSGNWWLCVHLSGGLVLKYLDVGTTGWTGEFAGDSYADGAADPAHVNGTVTNNDFSIFATYTTGISGTSNITLPTVAQTSNTHFGYANTLTNIMGSDVAGTQQGNNTGDRIFAFKAPALPVNADVTKVVARHDGLGTGAGSQVLKAVIYRADGTSGAPSTLVATSEEVTIADGAAAAWVDFLFPSTVSLTGPADYWLGIFTGATSLASRRHGHVLGGTGWLIADTYSNGPANPQGTGTFNGGRIAIYVPYTPTSGVGELAGTAAIVLPVLRASPLSINSFAMLVGASSGDIIGAARSSTGATTFPLLAMTAAGIISTSRTGTGDITWRMLEFVMEGAVQDAILPTTAAPRIKGGYRTRRRDRR